jgi:hypothetical protein
MLVPTEEEAGILYSVHYTLPAIKGYVDVLKYMLEKNDKHCADMDIGQVIALAIFSGRFDVVSLLQKQFHTISTADLIYAFHLGFVNHSRQTQEWVQTYERRWTLPNEILAEADRLSQVFAQLDAINVAQPTLLFQHQGGGVTALSNNAAGVAPAHPHLERENRRGASPA